MSDTAVTPRRARTRARLLASAREVIAERGAGGATVEGICERAGFTRGAFYSNYSSLPDLVADLIAEIAEARLAALRHGMAAMSQLPSSEQGLRSAVEIIVSLQPRSADEVLLITELELYAIRHPQAQSGQPAAAQRTRRLLDELIASLLDRFGRRLRTSPGVSVDLLYAYFDHISLALHAIGAGDPTDSLVEGLMELLSVITEPTSAS